MVRKSCHVGGTDGQLLQAEIATASSIGQVIALAETRQRGKPRKSVDNAWI